MNNINKGLFITFEGPEGCGKTTQSKKLVSYLKEKGLKVIYTREPGGTEIGDKIRKILLDNANKSMCAECEFFLYMANRAQNVWENVKKVDEGYIVVCDRFMDATFAYQGYGRGLPLERIIDINNFAIMGYVPDITFVLDVDVERGLHKAINQDGKECTVKGIGDRIEQAGLEFHKRVKDGYFKLQKKFPDRIVIIKEGSIDFVFGQILEHLKKKFGL